MRIYQERSLIELVQKSCQTSRTVEWTGNNNQNYVFQVTNVIFFLSVNQKLKVRQNCDISPLITDK